MQPRTAGASVLTRFVEANKRFCRLRLQPRLYAVNHIAALESWYRRRVKTHPEGALLDFGCGPNLPLTRLLGDRFARQFATNLDDVPGYDLPDGVTFARCTTDAIPFDDNLFDVVVIHSVIEHVDDPARTFAELARVTKPGGYVLFNLPNKWDYVSVLARFAGRFKSSILKTLLRTKWDDYPVKYRCNTRRALYRSAMRAGFDVIEFTPLPAPPYYLSFFVPLYILGAIYQFVISICGLDMLQPSFLVRLRKRP